MGVRDDKEHVRFKCRVTGLEATYVDTIPAEADNPDVDGVKVLYIPFTATNKSWIKALTSMGFRSKLVKETSTVYPRSAVKGPRINEYSHKEEGVAGKEVVAYEDQYGNAAYSEKYDLEMVEDSIQELEARINSLRKDKGLQSVENLEDKDENRIKDDVRKRKPENRRGFEELDDFENREGFEEERY